MKFCKFSALAISILAVFLGGCLGSSSNTKATTSPSPNPYASYLPKAPTGPRAARIIFRDGADGSFDQAPANGTASDSAHKAVRFFNPDGSQITGSSGNNSTWPTWISSVEIGISGPNNTWASNSSCARFSTVGEQENTLCTLGTTQFKCGAPTSHYRVSDLDCNRNAAPPRQPKFGIDDGVYIRVTFNRDTSVIAAHENIAAVLDYSASSFTSLTGSPSNCIASTTPATDTSNCPDMLWNVYLKHGLLNEYQPFLTLIPPASSPINPSLNTENLNITSRQIILPLASDPNLSILQISRIRGLHSSVGSLAAICNGSTNPSNSALCAGAVFYNLTLYRM